MIHMGCHLSSAKGFEHMGKEALSIGADTFAFFTRNPRGGKAKALDEEDVKGFLAFAEAHQFAKIVAHAPYTLNPCSDKEETREFAHMVMEDDLKRMECMPGNLYNFHPGSHVGQGNEKGIEMIADLLNSVLKKEQNTMVLLETMAGKGTEIGRSFEELKEIIDRVELSEKMGICLDTCHVSDAGYDIIHDLDGVLEDFDRILGMNRLKAMHINDSMNPPGAHKDRHAKIGEGYLGLETIVNVVGHPALQGLPCILETPNNLDGYGNEIQMIKERITGNE